MGVSFMLSGRISKNSPVVGFGDVGMVKAKLNGFGFGYGVPGSSGQPPTILHIAQSAPRTFSIWLQVSKIGQPLT